MNLTATRGFHKLCLSTLVAVYFLILLGGVVRTTGSGMGCPDWPKCFGYWVPPTSVDQLQANYKDTFSALRDKKNQKFARYLLAIGFDETATAILNDKSILEEADFNPTKTWIEYLNRLAGVIIGLLIVALFVKSFQLRHQQPSFFWLSLATLFTVIIQGWFGSIVVSTNLTSWTITIHMLLAFVLVALLVLLFVKSGEPRTVQTTKGIKILLAACMLLLVTQVLLGTEVRAAIDRVSSLLIPRQSWISEVWSEFVVHRSFSWIVVLFNAIFAARLIKTTGRNPLTLGLILLILLTLLTGAGMAYFAVPAFLQPIHLLVATVTFGIQFLLFLRLNTSHVNVLVN
ncbi:MAG TPA: COX15/CtaA family protein [Cyclobacteriaceae bacterium]|nr:COX15/CtaA family protein [Cyclobacteriaceae bacterium]